MLENNMGYDVATTSFDDDTLSLNLESLAIPLGTGLKFRIELTPSDIALSSYSVNENAAGAVIGDITVDDLNDADTHTMAVDDDRFEIVGGQLKLKADSSLDFNDAASIDVKITAEDSFGLTYEEIMTINVTDLVDRISGGRGNDTLLGTAGADIIRGKQGNDKLWGYGGDDVLRSKVGNDKFWGGAGADTFIYSTHSGRDTIMDFETGIDKIDLSKWRAIEDYADVKSHARNHGDDLWITAGKDTLVIKDFSKGELDVNDFLF